MCGTEYLMAPCRSDCLQVILKQLHGQRVVSRPAPAIALNAADQPLAIVVDLDQRATAVGADVVCGGSLQDRRKKIKARQHTAGGLIWFVT